MTRLSEALEKAATESASQPPATPEPPAPAWQFAPVETMHVPTAEPAPEPGEPAAAPPPAGAPDQIRVGVADQWKLIIDAGIDRGVVEQFRHLAAVLHHAQKARGVRSVMVTSAMPSEGKTLTATNLALTLSESYQRRVLLIDADLRRPRMREMFALAATHGLTDSLAAPRGERLPVHQITPTLWVLTAGRMLPDPMSMLASPVMKQLIDDAREEFDWVVVDTPPIAILPDANLLAAMIDTALLVVSAESTPYPMVQRAAQAVGPNRILGVVLNRAEKSGISSYNYYSYPSYQPGRSRSRPKRWLKWFGSSADPTAGQSHVQ